MDTPLPEPVEAAVMAGGTLTTYRAVGSGPPAILLVVGPGTDALSRLAAELNCRVIAPVPPRDLVSSDPATSFDQTERSLAWLTDFLDGLGLDAVHFLTEKRFDWLAYSLAAASVDRVLGHLSLDVTGALTWRSGAIALPRS